MDFFKNRYYRLNRLFLSLVGLWPYLNWRRKLITVSLLTAIYSSGVCLLILKMFEEECTISIIASSMQYLGPSIVCIMNLCYTSYYNNRMKILLEHIKCDWDILPPADSVILQQFAEIGYQHVVILSLLAAAVPFLHIPLMSLSNEQNIAEPNKTGNAQSPFPFEVFFIDYEEHVYCFFAVVIVTFLWGILILCSVGSLFLCSVQHACGLFSIVGQRLETMFDNWKGGFDIVCDKNDVVAEIVRTITYHSRAIEFIGIMNSMYSPLYLIELILVIAAFCSDILQLYGVYSRDRNVEMIIVYSGHTAGTLIGLVMLAYNGQILLNYSEDVFRKVYMSRWYSVPLNMQKLLLPVMATSIKEYGLIFSASNVVSYQLLVGILQLTLSYVVALNTLQE